MKRSKSLLTVACLSTLCLALSLGVPDASAARAGLIGAIREASASSGSSKAASERAQRVRSGARPASAANRPSSSAQGARLVRSIPMTATASAKKTVPSAPLTLDGVIRAMEAAKDAGQHTLRYAGREYQLRIGPRGAGYIVRQGRKVYVSQMKGRGRLIVEAEAKLGPQPHLGAARTDDALHAQVESSTQQSGRKIKSLRIVGTVPVVQKSRSRLFGFARLLEILKR